MTDEDERDSLAREVERLRACLQRANANHEEFERRWYLACDELERFKVAAAERLHLDMNDIVSGRDSRANIEQRTAEAIADYIQGTEARSQMTSVRVANDIRAGRWRKEGS